MLETHLERIARLISDGDTHATDGGLRLRDAIYITPSGVLVRADGSVVR